MDLGEIDAVAAKAAAVSAGPIRLLHGNRNWGWQHVSDNSERCQDILARGYATPLRYACAVASGWTSLRRGESGKITVVMPAPGYELALALKWTGACWSIVTMLPFRSNGQPEIYKKEEVAPDGRDPV